MKSLVKSSTELPKLCCVLLDQTGCTTTMHTPRQQKYATPRRSIRRSSMARLLTSGWSLSAGTHTALGKVAPAISCSKLKSADLWENMNAVVAAFCFSSSNKASPPTVYVTNAKSWTLINSMVVTQLDIAASSDGMILVRSGGLKSSGCFTKGASLCAVDLLPPADRRRDLEVGLRSAQTTCSQRDSKQELT